MTLIETTCLKFWYVLRSPYLASITLDSLFPPLGCILICVHILKYEDEDRDKVVLESDSDLVAAIDHAKLVGFKVRLYFLLVF